MVVILVLMGIVGCSSKDGPAPAGGSTIEAGGVSWHAVTRGPTQEKAKLTVLFLHGAAYTSKIWADRGILDDIAENGYRAVAVDLPGSGDTPSADKPKGEVLAALVEKIGPAEKVVIVSPSASGAYSLALLQDDPEVELGGFVGVAPAGIDGFRRPADAPEVPALLVWGANDDVIPFANAKKLAAQLPGSRTERIPDASHAAYDDKPDAFVDLLLPFLARAASTTSGSDATTTTTTTTTAVATTVKPEVFTGDLADFYQVPDPLPKGPPGALIRIQPIRTNADAVTLRVMYHSQDVRQRDRAVTGIITYPTSTTIPKEGWPVVAWAHGTTGLGPQCAPSRVGTDAPAFGIDGVRVATDYIGLGPLGERHAYLSGQSEAHSVIDAVRAARNLADAHAGKVWVAAGHSQGGHAALFTNQLGQRYAPELDLRGTVALAPASELLKTFGPADQVVPRMVGLMALYGTATDYPKLDPHDYVGPEVEAREGVIDTGCLNDIVNTMVTIPAETFYAKDPLTTEPARSIVTANDPGRVKVKAPLLVIYGTADTFVVPDRVHALFDRLCDNKQVTALDRVDGATHDTVVGQARDAITTWLSDRLAGRAAPDACSTGWK